MLLRFPRFLIPTPCQPWSQTHFSPNVFHSKRITGSWERQIILNLCYVSPKKGFPKLLTKGRYHIFHFSPLKTFSKIWAPLIPYPLAEKNDITCLVAFKASSLYKREVLNRSGKGLLTQYLILMLGRLPTKYIVN